MARRFTEAEITLCTYAALFDESRFGGISKIEGIFKRGRGSIIAKIQNIVAMCDESKIKRDPKWNALTGVPPGVKGRRTNWDWVEPLTRLSEKDLLAKCRAI